MTVLILQIIGIILLVALGIYLFIISICAIVDPFVEGWAARDNWISTICLYRPVWKAIKSPFVLIRWIKTWAPSLIYLVRG